MIKAMNKVFIIPTKNSEAGSLLLDVPLGLVHIPKWLSALSLAQGYKAKDEYHVTAIGLELAGLIQDHGKAARVKSLIDSFTWTIEISNQYIELAKDDVSGVHRQSIIGMVDVSELTQFYGQLVNILDITIDLPPAHVTLYTKNYDRGIGLYNENDLLRFKVRDLTESSKFVHGSAGSDGCAL